MLLPIAQTAAKSLPGWGCDALSAAHGAWRSVERVSLEFEVAPFNPGLFFARHRAMSLCMPCVASTHQARPAHQLAERGHTGLFVPPGAASPPPLPGSPSRICHSRNLRSARALAANRQNERGRREKQHAQIRRRKNNERNPTQREFAGPTGSHVMATSPAMRLQTCACKRRRGIVGSD